jgi:hypothetical protein
MKAHVPVVREKGAARFQKRPSRETSTRPALSLSAPSRVPECTTIRPVTGSENSTRHQSPRFIGSAET